jgi:hypothetical protein
MNYYYESACSPLYRLSPSPLLARGLLNAVNTAFPLTVGEESDSFQDFKAAVMSEIRENPGDGG